MEATQLENKINYLEKNKIDIDSCFCYKRKHKKFIITNKLLLKTQQRFKSDGHDVATEKIYKITVSSIDDERMKSTNSIKTYGSKHMHMDQAKI